MLFKSIKNYFNFSGRACKKEYWLFFLMFAIVSFFLLFFFIDYLLHGGSGILFFTIVLLLFWLFLIIPFISLSVRRFHDIGKSGSWFLILLIPFVGIVLYLIWMGLDSADDNKYGKKLS